MRLPLLTVIVWLGVCASAVANPDDGARYEAWLAKFKQADLNDSGGLSKLELDKTASDVLRDLKRDFAKVDASRDGSFTYDEYQDYLDDDEESPMTDSFKKLRGKN